MKFVDLGLREQILSAVANEGYTETTPIQEQAIPPILQGKDVLGSAQTGTGKTAAFALPIIQRLADAGAPTGHHKLRCLVLCPTRELATQIAESFRVYGKQVHLRNTVIFGGVNPHGQVDALRRGVDIIVATPGRLLDLLSQGHIDFRALEVLILDEADRMLDMGFINDIRKIVARLPKQRQTLLFSATMPPEIRRLADTLLHNPVTIAVAPVATPALVEQCVYFVDRSNKPSLLAHLVTNLPMSRAIVFVRTKHGADRVVRQLHLRDIRAEAIHGNKSQGQRQRALQNFKINKTPVLVATDIASRGLDIDDITHVVNYDLTHEPETYIHRIGRTARAGASGAAVSFCDKEEIPNLRGIEKLLRKSIPVKMDHPDYKTLVTPKDPFKHDRDFEDRPNRPRQNQDRSGGSSRGGQHRSFGGRASFDRDNRSRDSRGGDSNARPSRPRSMQRENHHPRAAEQPPRAAAHSHSHAPSHSTGQAHSPSRAQAPAHQNSHGAAHPRAASGGHSKPAHKPAASRAAIGHATHKPAHQTPAMAKPVLHKKKLHAGGAKHSPAKRAHPLQRHTKH